MFCRVRSAFEYWFGSDRDNETHMVRCTEAGTRYIDFECLRYAYFKEVDAFEECSIPLPQTYSQCIASAKGGCVGVA